VGPSFEQELEAELSALAERIGSTVRCLVHRDLQSHNVMIRDGEPLFIDFQGMRFGSPFYDLGSLLCDPYVNLSESELDELLSFYYGLSRGIIIGPLSETLSGKPRHSVSCKPWEPMGSEPRERVEGFFRAYPGRTSSSSACDFAGRIPPPTPRTFCGMPKSH